MHVGSFKFLIFLDWITKLDRLVQYEVAITTLYEYLTWTHTARSRYVHIICASFHCFKDTHETIERTGFKLNRPLATMDGHLPLWSTPLSETRRTCQKG